jgi:hypothetical protein
MTALMTLTGSDELQKFYNETFYFSYSSINKLLFSPSMFYSHYILRQKEDSTDSHLVSGRVLHCLLLEPENFNDHFIVMPGKMPNDNIRLLLDTLFKNDYLINQNDTLELDDFRDAIITQLVVMNLYQSLVDDKKDITNTGDKKRLDKVLTEQNKEYFNFLKAKENKTVVDQLTLDACNESVMALRNNLTVNQLLQIGVNDPNIKILNEQALKTEPAKYKFGFKGILDNVVLDYNTKTLFVNDLKTTGKPLQDFPNAVEYYKYWIQAVMYQQLCWVNYIKDLPDAKDWRIIITFIVIDKYNQIYPFQVSRDTLIQWKEKFQEILTVIDYHYSNRDYTLPYELALGNVIL